MLSEPRSTAFTLRHNKRLADLFLAAMLHPSIEPYRFRMQELLAEVGGETLEYSDVNLGLRVAAIRARTPDLVATLEAWRAAIVEHAPRVANAFGDRLVLWLGSQARTDAGVPLPTAVGARLRLAHLLDNPIAIDGAGVAHVPPTASARAIDELKEYLASLRVPENHRPPGDQARTDDFIRAHLDEAIAKPKPLTGKAGPNVRATVPNVARALDAIDPAHYGISKSRLEKYLGRFPEDRAKFRTPS
jgi:hypothetical protein